MFIALFESGFYVFLVPRARVHLDRLGPGLDIPGFDRLIHEHVELGLRVERLGRCTRRGLRLWRRCALRCRATGRAWFGRHSLWRGRGLRASRRPLLRACACRGAGPVIGRRAALGRGWGLRRACWLAAWHHAAGRAKHGTPDNTLQCAHRVGLGSAEGLVELLVRLRHGSPLRGICGRPA